MQTTFVPKKQNSKDQKWYLVDATDKIVGRMATTIANVLRGKNKPIFTPHLDCGDYVIIINAEKIKLTGAKLDKKFYYTHSGFKGGLKAIPARKVLAEKPIRIITEAVKNMLPNNRLRKIFLAKLKVYAGSEHKHEAQNPEILAI